MKTLLSTIFPRLSPPGVKLKILEMNLKKGYVKLIPENADDLWHLYNIIYRDDEVYAYTKREIRSDEQYSRKKRGEKVSVYLGVKVEKVYWDKLLGRLRIHGVICQAPDIVPTGAHHTLNVNLNSPLTIVKKQWANHHLERLKTAERESGKPIIIAAIDDEGYVIALTAHYGLNIRVEEHFSLPGKVEAEKRSESLKLFFRKALNSLRQIWEETHAPIVVIGVGFLKNDFVKYVEKEAQTLAQSIVDVKSVNNSGVAGVYEALRSGILTKTLHYLRVSDEAEAMEELLKRIGRNERNVVYGLKDVEKAGSLGAIETMLVADTLLREASDEQRLLIEEIMKSVEAKGGKNMVISTEHEAGEKLLALGGVAALLRFHLPEPQKD